MSYETFARLVHTESTLRRALHRSPPGQHRTLSRAIQAVHSRLRGCDSYDQWLVRMARTAQAMG